MPLVSSYIILRKSHGSCATHINHNTQRLPQRLCYLSIHHNKQRQFIFGVAILRWLFELHVQHTLFKGLSNDDLNQTTVAPTVFESSL